MIVIRARMDFVISVYAIAKVFAGEIRLTIIELYSRFDILTRSNIRTFRHPIVYVEMTMIKRLNSVFMQS